MKERCHNFTNIEETKKLFIDIKVNLEQDKVIEKTLKKN